ncbi:MAG: EamA family transporter, partial [Caldisericia bacterium]
MEILPLSLVMLSAFIHAFWNFLFKKSSDSVIFIFWAKVFEVILYLPIIILLLIIKGFNNKGIIYIISTGLIHYFYWLFLSLGYNSSDLTFVYPISRSSPLIITFLSYLLFKEKVTIFGFFGILLIILGIYFISIDSFSLMKFKIIFNKNNSGLLYALLTLITVSIYSLVDKIGAKYVNP